MTSSTRFIPIRLFLIRNEKEIEISFSQSHPGCTYFIVLGVFMEIDM